MLPRRRKNFNIFFFIIFYWCNISLNYIIETPLIKQEWFILFVIYLILSKFSINAKIYKQKPIQFWNSENNHIVHYALYLNRIDNIGHTSYIQFQGYRFCDSDLYEKCTAIVKNNRFLIIQDIFFIKVNNINL